MTAARYSLEIKPSSWGCEKKSQLRAAGNLMPKFQCDNDMILYFALG